MAAISPREEIVAQISAMDRCWLERRFADLKSHLTEDAVFVTPNGRRVLGRDAAVESYREFMSRSQVHRYQASEPMVTQKGDTAVAEYGWDMAWDSDGQSYEAKGREVLVLAREDGAWSVIWRTQLGA
jgi:ketosteroid isomerase-like protein